eukprot:2572214-Rhodomonas_salina.2
MLTRGELSTTCHSGGSAGQSQGGGRRGVSRAAAEANGTELEHGTYLSAESYSELLELRRRGIRGRRTRFCGMKRSVLAYAFRSTAGIAANGRRQTGKGKTGRGEPSRSSWPERRRGRKKALQAGEEGEGG